MIKNSLLLALVLAFAVFHFSDASYRDAEGSAGNQIELETFDIEVNSEGLIFQAPVDVLNFLPGESIKRQVEIENKGSGEMKYNINFKKEKEDGSFCSALDLAVVKGLEKAYDGNLVDFDEDFDGTLSSRETDELIFEISLDFNATSDLESQDCDFSFIFTAWQADFLSSNQGWVDTEKIEEQIHSGSWTVLPIESVANFLANRNIFSEEDEELLIEPTKELKKDLDFYEPVKINPYIEDIFLPDDNLTNNEKTETSPSNNDEDEKDTDMNAEVDKQEIIPDLKLPEEEKPKIEEILEKEIVTEEELINEEEDSSQDSEESDEIEELIQQGKEEEDSESEVTDENDNEEGEDMGEDEGIDEDETENKDENESEGERESVEINIGDDEL